MAPLGERSVNIRPGPHKKLVTELKVKISSTIRRIRLFKEPICIKVLIFLLMYFVLLNPFAFNRLGCCHKAAGVILSPSY